MESENFSNQNNNQPQQLDIAKFTIKTFFWVIVVGILLISSFLNFFSYPALKFYTSLNIKTRALESAEFYLKGYNNDVDVLPASNSKYADALLCAVNNSIALMNTKSAKDYDSKQSKKYAKIAEKYTGLYLAYNVSGSMSERSATINTYNLSHSSPQNHPSLVSFADFLAVKQAKARFILGKDSVVYDECLLLASEWEKPNWQVSSNKKTLNDNFVMFDKLNQYLSRELSSVGFYNLPKTSSGAIDYNTVKDNIKISTANFNLFVDNNGNFTKLYNIIQSKFDDFKQYLKLNSTNQTSNSQLYSTYYLKIMTEFVQNMEYFSMVISANNQLYSSQNRANLIDLHKKVWIPNSQVTDVTIYEQGVAIKTTTTMQKWYTSGMLIDYIQLYLQGK